MDYILKYRGKTVLPYDRSYGGFGFKKEDGLKCMCFEPDIGRKIVIEKTLESEGWTSKDIIEWYNNPNTNKKQEE